MPLGKLPKSPAPPLKITPQEIADRACDVQRKGVMVQGFGDRTVCVVVVFESASNLQKLGDQEQGGAHGVASTASEQRKKTPAISSTSML